jgi:hypothetical protein
MLVGVKDMEGVAEGTCVGVCEGWEELGTGVGT